MPRTILIADDDPSVLSTLKMGLEAKGYRVIAAADGLEGIEKACVERPDFVILDFHMAGGGGTAAYEALRELQGSIDTPILFLTAMPIKEVKASVKFRGRTRFLSKPAGINEILRVIKECLGD